MANVKLVGYLTHDLAEAMAALQADEKLFPERLNNTQLLRLLIRKGLESMGRFAVDSKDDGQALAV